MSDYKAMLVPVREEETEELSMMATYMVEQHIQSYYGRRQKEYMLESFQSADAIRRAMKDGEKYYWIDSIPAGEKESVLAMLDMCGYLSCSCQDHTIVITNLYIMEETRGRHLMRECMELLARAEDLPEGMERIRISIPEGYVDAIAVFEHIGFEKEGKEEISIGKNYKLNCVNLSKAMIS